MKTGTDDRDSLRGAGKKEGSGDDWKQQVDYPVAQDRDAGGDKPSPAGNSLEERIRFKAWLRAKERGFTSGDEVVDWLEAEREVNEEERERNSGSR